MPTPQANHRPRWSQVLLALVGPIVVLGLAAHWFAQPPDRQLSKAAIAFEKQLEEEKPDVVLLGNSMARLGINTDQLAKTIDAKVLNLSVDGSSASLWYLLLKNRVYAKGHRPHAVVILGAARTHLAPFPLSSLETLNVGDHREPIEPVFDGKAHGGNEMPLGWLWATWRRDRFRKSLLDGIRNLLVGKLFAGEIEAAGGETEPWAEEQLKLVFGGEQNLIGTAASRVIPVVEHTKDIQGDDAKSTAESYLPDLVSLSEEHGTRLVFVRMPMAPSGPSDRGFLDLTDAPFEAEWLKAIDWLGNTSAAYVDLRNIGLNDGDFIDFIHANRGGQKKITEWLGQHFDKIGLMGDSPLPKVVNLSPKTIARTGQLPDIPTLSPEKAVLKHPPCGWYIPLPTPVELATGPLGKLGIGPASPVILNSGSEEIKRSSLLQTVPSERCESMAFVGRKSIYLSGERPTVLPQRLRLRLDERFPSTGNDGSPYYWVFPGQQLTANFPRAWPEEAGTFQISLTAVQIEEAPPLSVQVNEDEPHVAPRIGLRIDEQVTATAPTIPWKLTIAVPSDGAPTLIQSLSVGEGFMETWMIDGPKKVATRRAIGGKRRTFEYAQTQYPVAIDAINKREDGMILFKATAGRIFADGYGLRQTGLWGCSPIKVALDGEPIGRGHRACKDVPTSPPGSFCHNDDEVIFKAPVGTDPSAEPERWSLILDPALGCSNGNWLFPGDTLTANPWRKDTAAMPAGIRSVVIRGQIIVHPKKERRVPTEGPDQPIVNMEVRVGEQVLLNERLSRGQLQGDSVRFAIDPPVHSGKERVVLTFSSPLESPYVVINSASVSEDRIIATQAEVTP